MRFGVMVMAGLMMAVTAQAQQTKAAQQTKDAQQQELKAKVLIIASGLDCPAGALRAHQRTAGGATIWTTAQEDPGKRFEDRTPGSLGVHVDFNSATNPVRSLELSVSYLPLKLRMMPVAEGANAKDRQKTFVLKQEAARRMDADLLVGSASAIETVHLVSATFADGSVWRARDEDVCTVEPSAFMLVGGK
jgi:hypothetical protein